MAKIIVMLSISITTSVSELAMKQFSCESEFFLLSTVSSSRKILSRARMTFVVPGDHPHSVP
jgi:hypothetical protein